MGVYGQGTTTLSYPAGKAVSRRAPWIIPRINSDRLPAPATKTNSTDCLGAPLRVGSAWAIFWPPPGCACTGLPAHWVPRWASPDRQMWGWGLPTPRAVRDTSRRPGLYLGSQFVLCALQLELWPDGNQLRYPLMGFRGPSRPRPAFFSSADSSHQLAIPVWGCILGLIRQSPCHREEPAPAPPQPGQALRS